MKFTCLMISSKRDKTKEKDLTTSVTSWFPSFAVQIVKGTM